MKPSRSRFITVAAALLALSGCTTSGLRTTRGSDGWETATEYRCDWKRDSSFLKPGSVPNSPFMPFTRANWAKTSIIVVILAMPVDLIASPIAYAADRECEAVGSDRRFVGTPESRRAEKLAQAKREREARASDTAEQRKRDADAAAARAESDKIAALYPPLNDSPKSFAPRPNDFALIVGIESYRSIAAKADFGENDAKSARTYLEAIGVPPANVITLIGAQASRSDIAKYLEEWLPGVVKPDSRVYFYYSGHGAPDPQTGTAYLVPYDGDPSFLKSTAFPLSKIYADLAALPAKESVVMLDSCFSGAGGRSVLAPGVRPLVVTEDATTAPDKIDILAASGAREIAGGLDLRQHGLFTYFLLRGLAGEAADKDGHVTLGGLNEFVRGRVGETARRANREQTPRLLGDSSLKLY